MKFFTNKGREETKQTKTKVMTSETVTITTKEDAKKNNNNNNKA